MMDDIAGFAVADPSHLRPFFSGDGHAVATYVVVTVVTLVTQSSERAGVVDLRYNLISEIARR